MGDDVSAVRFNGWQFRPGSTTTTTTALTDIPDEGTVAIMAFSAPVTAQRRASLREQGIELLAYVPDGGWLARIERREQRANDPDSVGAVLFQPLSPELRISRLFEANGDGDRRSVYVHVVPDRDGADLEADLLTRGYEDFTRVRAGTHSYLAGSMASDRLPGLLQMVGQHADVQVVEPAGGAKLFNDVSAPIVQSGSYDGGRPFFDNGIYGSNQVIAVCDTGIDADSCYYREVDGSLPPTNRLGNSNVNPARRKVIAVDFLYAADDPATPTHWDSYGHGTRVAGHAAGSRLDLPISTSVNNGMAPGAQLVVQDGGYAVNDCADLPGLGCPVTGFLAVLEQAYAHGARIHNNSWGDRENYFPHNTYTQPCRDVDMMTWSNRDFLVVCAGGNDSADDTVNSPSVAKNALSVAATQPGDAQESIASFSSRGWASDGRIKPDLAAPGQDVISSTSNGSVTSPNCTTGSGSGTSYSAPMVAGLAALVRDYFAQGFYPTGTRVSSNALPSISAALVKAVLINSAAPMLNAVAAPPSRDQGWGRVDLSQALPLGGGARSLRVVDALPQFVGAAGEDYRFYLDVTSTSTPLRITLVWTDYPATAGATKHLVNDLDLRVRVPGISLLGNVLSAGWSTTNGLPDRENNVEQILWHTPQTGILEVVVATHLVAAGTQDFAVVCSGPVDDWAMQRDDDGDTLPDAWELQHFGDLERTQTEDEDGDGASHADEWMAGTSPVDSNDVFRVMSLVGLTSSNVVLSWHSVAGRTYSVAASTALVFGVWDTIHSNIPATGPMNTFTTAVESAPATLYRLGVKPEPSP